MKKVGIYYDPFMEKHKHKGYHAEQPERIGLIYTTLKEAGIFDRCDRIYGLAAAEEHLSLVHTPEHIRFIKDVATMPDSVKDSHRYKNSKRNDVYFNKHSYEAALLAAGGAIELARRVADEELSSGFAIVRPPGHHAEKNACMGFCLFNNIALAASFLLNKQKSEKILIVDWDIHHGNGTQEMFFDDPRVLFFSVHRYGTPTEDGSHTNIGRGVGKGYNINVPWSNSRRSNADYIAVWDYVLLPVAREFKPDIVLVSAGFDAASNDPIGDCDLTADGYAVMLEKLKQFAGGKVVLVLEGGYSVENLPENLPNCVLACVEVLTDTRKLNTSFGSPHVETYDVIKLVRETLREDWSVLADEVLPGEVLAFQGDSFMDPDPTKARKAALRIARSLVSPGDQGADQGGGLDDIFANIGQCVDKLQRLSLRLKDLKETADQPEPDQPESSGR